MIFNSATFLVFFACFFFAYWYINNKKSVTGRNILIIASSYLFYGWWDWRFLSLIFISSLTDFLIGIYLDKTLKPLQRKLLLWVSIVVNLGILGLFKYFNFFIESLSSLLSQFNITLNPTTLKIVLPVGISFYTFQTLSYTIDVFKRKLAPTKDVTSFFAFVAFFPQLVAGPIERASNLLPQFSLKKQFSYAICKNGLQLVLWGFFKKIVIADNFGIMADAIFSPSNNPSGVILLFGATIFALQIYTDFSGYSDIAIGIAKMIGFDLMTNFKTPYFSKSFGEFWQRWHISLSTWFRDYVYIPLGGNRVSTARMHVNIFITFLLSGLWHGADVTFLIWGGLHGLLLIIEKQFQIKKLRSLSFVIVLFSVIILYLPFRAESFAILQDYCLSLIDIKNYSINEIQKVIADYSTIRYIVLMLVLTIFLWIEYQTKNNDFVSWINQKNKIIRVSIYYLITLAILFIGNFSVKPSFIYFQF